MTTMNQMLFSLALLAGAAADDKEAEEAIARFKTAYKNTSAPARAAAVTELAKAPHEKTLKQLLPLLGGEEKVVKIAVAKGLGGFADFKKQVTPVLSGALAANQKEPEVQVAILEALGALDDDAALGTLHRTFDDKNGKVAGAAFVAAGMVRNIASIDVMIDHMKKIEKYLQPDSGGGNAGVDLGVPGGGDDPNRMRAREVMPSIIKGLSLITKEKWTTSKEWLIWWGRYKATFKIEK
jgi:hypothetical protein